MVFLPSVDVILESSLIVTNMSSNWSKLQQKLETSKIIKQQTVVEEAKTSSRKRKRVTSRHEINDAVTVKKAKETVIVDTTSDEEKAKYIALDCEMVGIGTTGKMSALARCALVDYDGNKIYDKYVRPKSFVTDFRTKYSGIRVQDLRQGHAITFEEVCRQYWTQTYFAVYERGSRITSRKNTCWACLEKRFGSANARSSSIHDSRHCEIPTIHAGKSFSKVLMICS